MYQIPEIIFALIEAVQAAGGRALLVGGCVRDRYMNRIPKDWDVEVSGLTAPVLEAVLARFGTVDLIGQQFGTYKIHQYPDLDIALPRRDSSTGAGHRDFASTCLPDLPYREASLRRDFTVNSMGFCPVTEELLDPHGGLADIRAGILRATDPSQFGEDRLRALRAVRFTAQLGFRTEPETTALCQQMDLSPLPGERLMGEMEKLLLAPWPQVGIRQLFRLNLARFFPEIAALDGVPQEPEFHPEGCVLAHTEMVVAEAALLRTGDRQRDLTLMLGALCHDLGKPATTELRDGRIRSAGHEAAGEAPTRSLMGRLRADQRLTEQVVALVQTHLAPTLYPLQGAGRGAYRRLARHLIRGGADIDLLVRVNRADHLGRTTEDALLRQHPQGDIFRQKVQQAGAEAPTAVHGAVMGRHLIERGMKPGRGFGPLLARCLTHQDETGETDPNRILDAVLAADA